ncbi:MAG: SARP family transcriptional regulator [Actinophytocola sp.]|uniref:AfsR/SARP family transcriptional regulator n=1 Tax=Actinophytocola sp. TaxID=1872138 RepID=UPI001329B4F7|nr:BTAD domain-containing putative transcriptional regulator [Actinophytocola sp.]MPZ82021.1 SARP family transcriptional regulator [Actinophytocola sp.]
MADPNGSRAAATVAGLRFCLLGPVQVLVHGRTVPIGGPGMRGVLAMLLLEPNQVVPLDRMVDVLWAHEPPASARTMVQGYVSRLRQRLGAVDEGGPDGAVRIATAPPGYRLEVDEALIDVTVARTLLAEARGTPAVRRAGLLRDAQALWHGTELADLGGRLSAPELTELRLAVLEARFDADLELGRHHEIIGELTQLVDEQPFRERLVGQLVLALYRSDRRATALAAYQRFARRASDELGMDPGPQLRGLHLRVLRDDTTLLEPSPEPVVAPRVGVLVPAQLPRAPSGFAGRDEELAWLHRLLPAGSDSPRAEPAVAVLAGPAGVGKTALAVLWAHGVAERFPDGQLFASLRGFDPQHAPMSADDVLTQFLLALGVGVEDVPAEIDDRASLYRSILAHRRVLVVLDDARDSEQIRPLLPAGSSSLVVVTTRVRLDALVAWTGARLQVLGTLAADAAEKVIEHMAGGPAQGRDRELRRKLARLCGHLPLALRIAGARLTGGPQWSVAGLVEELADERGRLSALDLEEADTSVRAALDVTYRSLRPELAETLRLLGLFPGTMIGPYPVAALCGIDVELARRRLRTLAGSFVVTETSRDVFLMHDLVRLHAHELAEHELSEVDKVAARTRLRRYYLVGVDQAKRQLRSGLAADSAADEYPGTPRPPITTPAAAIDWIDQEWANLLAVVESGLETGQDEEIVRLARMASEFSEGTRTLGPVALGRAVRLVV